MHDTNQRNLFNDDYRFDSHGCSRVDNVRDLAAWLLQEEMPKWNRAAIDAAIATGQREDIVLPKKVPVAWIYLTAWMTKDQTVSSATTSMTRTSSFWKPPPKKRRSSIRRQPSVDGASGAVDFSSGAALPSARSARAGTGRSTKFWPERCIVGAIGPFDQGRQPAMHQVSIVAFSAAT